MRAAAYLRVSTDGQTVENQRIAVERFCAERGWSLVRTYEETASGAAKKRPEFDRLMRDALNGRGAGFDLVLVVRLDRLTRGGALAALEAIGKLDKAGLGVASIAEPWLDTAGPFREVLIAFAATVAKMERATLVERTKAGLERAKAQGKKLGRPRIAEPNLARAALLARNGHPVRDAARMCGVSEATLRRYLAGAT